MADNPIIITLPYTADLDRGPVEQYLPVAFGTGDKEAHRLVLTAYRSTGIVDLTGAGVLCYVNRADKSTVVVDGEVVDGKAVVLLTEECYIVNGVVSIIVKLTMGDTRATVLWLTGNINRTSNGKLVDPGGVVPTLDALLAEIDNMRTATAEGVAAAEEAREAAKEVEGAAEEARQAIADMSRTTAPAIVNEASGDMVVVTDGAARPALSLVSQISAVQEGTGDPSPDNVRPIAGWDAVTLTRTGRNMLDLAALRLVQISTGETRWGMQYTRPGTYALHANVPGGDADYVYARVTDGSGAEVGNTMHLVTGSSVRSYAVTLEAGQTLTVWYVRDLDEETVKECMLRTQVQVEMGDRTAYAPGQSTAITAELPETVFGGTLDWLTGLLTVTHGHIDAYAGEDVPEGWISSVGELTDGAQVVYPLASPYTIQIDPKTLDMLRGDNTVWCNTGSTAVGYVADTKMYVESHGGVVQDVQVDGKSIVTDGIVNISKYDIVKDGMCDGKGAAWTSDEQAAARERMGIGEYQLINDITVEEDIDKLTITSEQQGISYNLKKFIVIMSGFPEKSGSSYFRIDAWTKETANLFVKYLNATKDKYIFLLYEAISHNLFRVDAGVQEKNSNIFVKGCTDICFQNYKGQAINDTNIIKIDFQRSSSTDTLKAGINIKIYGVRA